MTHGLHRVNNHARHVVTQQFLVYECWVQNMCLFVLAYVSFIYLFVCLLFWMFLISRIIMLQAVK